MPPAIRMRALVRALAADVSHRRRGSDTPVAAEAIGRGIEYLVRTHDATGRRGSSKGFSMVRGWNAAFPETTGYVIGTLLARAAETGDEELVDRAHQMGEWEIEVQGADGGIMEGLVTTSRPRSIVFNTGMVAHGWLDLHEHDGADRWLQAAIRAGEFLVGHQRQDGSWSGEATYANIPHTYNSRAAWALVRLAQATGDERYATTARRNLEWVVSRQRPNGWFDDCFFKPGMLPSTHAIAYTTRGLLESGVLLGDAAFVESSLRGAAPLLDVAATHRHLPATYDAEWRPRARYECLTGTAQMGGVWLRQHQVTGDGRLREAGLAAVEHAAAHQVASSPSAARGALPGSFPIFGRYAPLQYPNWATKFLVDALMLRRDLLEPEAGEPAAVPGSVPRRLPAELRAR